MGDVPALGEITIRLLPPALSGMENCGQLTDRWRLSCDAGQVALTSFGTHISPTTITRELRTIVDGICIPGVGSKNDSCQPS
jgi:hypothetical protein